MVKSMAHPNGRMAVILPHGALFRSGAEARIRKELIDNDLVETIIGLGPNLFYGTGISACILVLKLNKEKNKRNKVYFIDASNQYQKGRNQNYFLDEHTNNVLSWYESYKDIENISRVVEASEIAENDYNLNLLRYIKKIDEEDKISLKEVYKSLLDEEDKFNKSQKEMTKTLEKYNLI